MVSAKKVSQILQKKNGQAFLGLLRTVDEGIVLTDGDMNNPVSDLSQCVSLQNLPECVRAVLGEFQDVFLDDLPKGTPPIH